MAGVLLPWAQPLPWRGQRTSSPRPNRSRCSFHTPTTAPTQQHHHSPPSTRYSSTQQQCLVAAEPPFTLPASLTELGHATLPTNSRGTEPTSCPIDPSIPSCPRLYTSPIPRRRRILPFTRTAETVSFLAHISHPYVHARSADRLLSTINASSNRSLTWCPRAFRSYRYGRLVRCDIPAPRTASSRL